MQRHDKLISDLRVRISDGSWPVGQMIPGRRLLAEEYGVALATLERAVSVLMAEGLLRADSRRGTVVVDRQQGLRAVVDQSAVQRGSLTAAVALVTSVVQYESLEMRAAQAQARILAGCEHALASEPGLVQHFINTLPTMGVDLTPADVAARITSLGCGYVVLIGDAQDELATTIEALGLPMIVAAYDPGPSLLPQVYLDGAMGGSLALRHLHARGYAPVTFLRPFINRWVDLRLSGVQAASSAPVSIVPREPRPGAPPHALVEDQYPEGLAAAEEFLDAGFTPGCGIIAPNDTVACAFIEAASRRGLTAGVDYGIVGFDDNLLDPSLTTLSPPFAQLGEAAGRNLLHLVRGEAFPSRVALPHRLIPRRSTAHRIDADTVGANPRTGASMHPINAPSQPAVRTPTGKPAITSRRMPQQAFSLIELLITVAIICILIGLLLPVINIVRESARKVACMSRLSQIGAALLVYAGDNKGWFPPVLMHAHRIPVLRVPDEHGVVSQNGLGFLFPQYLDLPPRGTDDWNNYWTKFLSCPNFEEAQAGFVSYRYKGNPRSAGPEPTWDSVWNRRTWSGVRNGDAQGPARLDQPDAGASRVILVSEAIDERGPGVRGTDTILHPHPRDHIERPAGPVPLVAGGNILLVDGHVMWLPGHNWTVWYDRGGGNFNYKPDTGF